MTLRINVDRCRDAHELWVKNPEGVYDYDPVTFGLAQAMWHTEIGRIIENNVDEVLRRVQIAEKINGAYKYNGPDDDPFTREEIERRIGMFLNVETISKVAFDKKVRESTK